MCFCPVVADPSDCGSGGRASNSNYFLANNCQPITGLTVSFTATQDIVSNNGFSVQLNADSQQGVDAFQQYLFEITGTSIKSAINNWVNPNTAIVCGITPVATTTISNGIPKGYTLRITLQYAGSSVSGALFEVINGGVTLGSVTSSVSTTGCGCGMAKCPSTLTCCRGFQSSADLSPISAFQLNVVGPSNGASTTFKSGAGSIKYSVSSGTLTALSSPPSCIVSDTCTTETSNASYGQLDACAAQSITQSFST